LDLSGSEQGAGGIGGLLAVLDAVNGSHFAAFDGNGNVTALVSAAGANSATYEYGPFGEVLRATGPMAKANPSGFSTKSRDDETDLLYYGYRYYNPSTGRWLSLDPLETAARNTAHLGMEMFSGLQPVKVDAQSGFFANPTLGGDSDYFAFGNAPLTHYDSLGLASVPCTTPEVNGCVYQCKTDYPGADTAQHCKAELYNFLFFCVRSHWCNCTCKCTQVGGAKPDPGDPQHKVYVAYECPGFGQLGGSWPKGVPIPSTITPLCADLKKKMGN
jgi:RHS repeat-associated protein